jgi:uncharacterized protein with HEPN domain
MHPKSPKWLDDIRRSSAYIEEDTAGLTLEDYLGDRRVRQLVERNLGIIGEAAARLRRDDPDTAASISDLNRIIGLRHRLAHGYDEEIDDALVWKTVLSSVPVLHAEVAKILSRVEP